MAVKRHINVCAVNGMSNSKVGLFITDSSIFGLWMAQKHPVNGVLERILTGAYTNINNCFLVYILNSRYIHPLHWNDRTTYI